MNAKKDIGVRIGIAWTTIKKLNSVWKSQLSIEFKIEIYNSLVKSVLLYSCETWSLTKALEKKIEGANHRLLRYSLNISWKLKIPNAVAFAGIIEISEVIRERRVRFAGHCLRAKDQPVSELVLWEGAEVSGKRKLLSSFPKILCNDLLRLGYIDEEEELAAELIKDLAEKRVF